jgi:PAS domain S-box-containing protein
MLWGLVLGVAAVVVGGFAIGAYVFSAHHYQRVLQAGRATAQTQAETMRMAIEHAMRDRDHGVIEQMVRTFGSDPNLSAVLVLDAAGRVVHASQPGEGERGLTRDSPTCRVCHQQPPEKRDLSRVVDTRDGAVLRIVTPIRNRPECHGCHAPERRINGVLIVDVKAGAMRAALNRELRGLIAGSGLLALFVMAGVTMTVRFAVVRRLKRIESVARAIAAGDLERRVPVEGDDILSWLALEFNTLADAVTGLAADVRRHSERLESIINSVDDGIVVLDRQLRIVAANDGFVRRTGRSRGDLVGRSCDETVAGLCDRGRCAARALLDAGVRRSMVVECAGPDGALRAEEVHVSSVPDPDGHTAYVVEAWRDITDRRAAEARMAESHRLASLGMLASGFSHELNTPLGTTLTCVEAITRTATAAAPDLDQVRESARIAREQLLRCRGVTQQFLRMARGDVATLDLVDLEALVPDVTPLLVPMAREHGVEVTLERGGQPVTVRANLAAVQQVLLNLLINAVQACARGGHVVVGVERGPPRLIVTDDGRGMTAEEQRRIFEPFFSLRPGGTGLGLFICLEAARAWGGEIRVTSAPGRGARFEVRFAAPGVAGGHDG